MKKSFIIITSIILLCIMIVGCQSTDATISASNELNKNLNLLSNTVSRLDTVDNEYLVSNELYTLNNVPTQQKSFKNVLAKNNFENDKVSVDKISLTDDLTKALSDELINRVYCDNNGNCVICKDKYTCTDDNMCGSCNQTIICDSNGNCTSCGDILYLDNNNNCNSCKTSCISNVANSNISENTKSCLNKISTHNKELTVDFISTDNNDIVVKNDSLDVDNDTNDDIIDNNLSFDNNITNEENNNANEEAMQENTIPQYKFFFYEENSFAPDLRYKPRFISNINYDSANSKLNNYIEKLQKLYTMTADVVEANNTLADYKIMILDNIDETKELNNCILTGNCTPSNHQVIALNNYVEDIKSTVNNLRKLNGNLTSEINKISSTNTGITQSIDITNSNYLRILNQIDTRISYHENAIATLEQIQYLLQDAVNSNTNENVEIEDLNNNVIIDSEDLNNSSTDDETIENDTIINIPSIDEDSNDTTNSDEANNNNTEIIVNDDEVVIDQEDNTTNTTNDNIVTTDKPIIDDNDSSVSIDTTVEDTNEIVEEENTTTSNVDTYQDNLNNLDLTTENDEVDENISNENNNDNLENTDTDDAVVTDQSYVDNNTTNNNTTNLSNDTDAVVTNPNNTPQMVDGSDNNLTNNYNNINNNNINNTNDNTIISQNNLDNNHLGNNSYRYDDNGALYNNTNGYNNNALNNVNERNNNVNTYKYNTLVDSINRGTVNNGINNL